MVAIYYNFIRSIAVIPYTIIGMHDMSIPNVSTVGIYTVDVNEA